MSEDDDARYSYPEPRIMTIEEFAAFVAALENQLVLLRQWQMEGKPVKDETITRREQELTMYRELLELRRRSDAP